MIGKRIGRYEIRALIGKGGMGEVYSALDTSLDRVVALKILPPDLQQDPERRARIEREAKTVAALNHPNVVTLHAVEEIDGLFILVMELVEGRTLDAVVPGQGLPLDRFFATALPLAEAVSAAHARGITHRDLKSQNVMIDGDGRVKVLDFGLARWVETQPEHIDQTMTIDSDMTREGVVVGTAAYMSPEQAEGKPIDPRSDVFSLGVLLYEMITGRRPFTGETRMSTLTSVLRDDPRPLVELRDDIPRQVGRILRRCLEKDPELRYETARGVVYDLEILRDEVYSGEHAAQAAPPAADPVRRSTSHRRMWIGGAMVAAMLAAVVFWWAPLRDRGAERGAPAALAAADETPAEPMVVVFPFENLGPPEEAYFAAGVTDEIITRLTGVDGLRVVSRTSALHYDRTGKSMPQIASELGVDYVLEGAVRWQRGDGETSRVRVTPQLMDAASDEQLWAEPYDRAMAEIFKVQSEIADEVVRSLGVTLAVSAGQVEKDIPTEDMNAYHAYLRAREIIDVSRFNAESWFLAVDLLEKAVARDPDFHEAWVQLAKSHSGMCHFNWDRNEARLAQAKTAADHAFALKPDDAHSHMARGYYYYWGRKDYEQALAAFRKADGLRSDDPEIRLGLAYVLRRQENYAEAADILIDVSRFSPRDPALAMHIGETLGILGRYDEALAWSERAVELGPGQESNYSMAANVAIRAGRAELARHYMDLTPPSTDPEAYFWQFRSYYLLRDYAEALRFAEKLPDVLESQYVVISRPLALAGLHRAMDMPDAAREDFARAEAHLSAKLAEKPEAGNLVAAHAIALAGLGRADEALAEIERSFTLYPAVKDLWIQGWRVYDKAIVQMLSDRPAEAVGTLAELMKRETDVLSPSLLRTSPDLDPLRGRADFQALLVGGV